jgi:hypothetical protein
MTFSNPELSDILTKTNNYAGQLLEALYSQYRAAYAIVRSRHFRGGSADAFKEYMDIVAIHFISRIMDLALELIEMANNVNSSFLGLEPANNGIMDEATIDSTRQTLGMRYSDFEGLMIQTRAILNRARAYVTPTALNEAIVHSDFIQMQNELSGNIDGMEATNNIALQHVSSFKNKLDDLRSDMNQFLNEYSTGERIDFLNVQNLSEQQWFDNSHGNALLAMWLNDPFVYVEEHGAIWENQWVTGDIEDFAYFGMSVLSGHVQYSLDSDGLIYNRSHTGLSLTAGRESENLSAHIDARLLNANVNARFGWSEDYQGFNLSARAVVASIEASMTLGDGIVSVNASGRFCNANAYAIFEFESQYDWHVGAGAHANVAEGSVGLRFFEYPTTNGGTTHLFGASVSGSAVSAGAGASLRSQNVHQNDFLAVNAITLDLGFAVFFGLDASITFPTVCFGNTFVTVGNTIRDAGNAFLGWLGW